MSEEMEINEKKEKECKCFCHSKGFKRFLTVALGTFVGVYCALCLFTALHRPPMPPQNFMPPVGIHNRCPYAMMQHHFDKADKGKDRGCHKPKKCNNNVPAPFEQQRPE